MKRHWSHWLNLHTRCHPARCATAARICNEVDSQNRVDDYMKGRS